MADTKPTPTPAVLPTTAAPAAVSATTAATRAAYDIPTYEAAMEVQRSRRLVVRWHDGRARAYLYDGRTPTPGADYADEVQALRAAETALADDESKRAELLAVRAVMAVEAGVYFPLPVTTPNGLEWNVVRVSDRQKMDGPMGYRAACLRIANLISNPPAVNPGGP